MFRSQFPQSIPIPSSLLLFSLPRRTLNLRFCWVFLSLTFKRFFSNLSHRLQFATKCIIKLVEKSQYSVIILSVHSYIIVQRLIKTFCFIKIISQGPHDNFISPKCPIRVVYQNLPSFVCIRKATSRVGSKYFIKK